LNRTLTKKVKKIQLEKTMKNQARIIQLLNRLENMLKIEIEKARTDQDKDAIKLLDKLYNLVKKTEVNYSAQKH